MHVVRVNDLGHEALGDYAGLTDVTLRRAFEPAGGLYIAESAKVIARALGAGHRPRSVLLQEKWLTDLEPMLEAFDGPIFVAQPDLLEKLTGFTMHRGALASMHRPPLPSVEETVAGARCVVVLEDLVDHTNVGAVFRAVAGLGADAVLITPRCADPLYRRSVRVSMGTVFQVPWTRLSSWPGDVSLLKGLGFHVAALALHPDAAALDSFVEAMDGPVALVLGAEGDGLSQDTMREADSIVTIPMLHGVDSLNVASASAVAIYALSRRHGT